MQQRRFRPGDVLDDYCPRERRVTDHAIVAMIDDTIQQTRCVVCDAEHAYKKAKVPPQRKKTPALFTQVLDGLKAPARPANQSAASIEESGVIHDDDMEVLEGAGGAEGAESAESAEGAARAEGEERAERGDVPLPVAPAVGESQPGDEPVDGPLFRRRLIRAALPRPEGTPPPTRAMPEFTMRQPLGRNRPGRGRRGGGQHQGQGFNGPMRFGRDGHGQRSNGHGRPPGGHRGHGGHAGHGGPNPSTGSGRGGNRPGGSRRGPSTGSGRGGKKR